MIISENKWTKVVAASTHQTASTSGAAASEQQQQPHPLQQTHIEAVKAADVVLDCSNDQIVKCHIFTCRIHGGLRANESAVVRLRSRVWNSTLVEEFGLAASTVAIHAKAHLGSDFVKKNLSIRTMAAFRNFCPKSSKTNLYFRYQEVKISNNKKKSGLVSYFSL